MTETKLNDKSALPPTPVGFRLPIGDIKQIKYKLDTKPCRIFDKHIYAKLHSSMI